MSARKTKLNQLVCTALILLLLVNPGIYFIHKTANQDFSPLKQADTLILAQIQTLSRPVNLANEATRIAWIQKLKTTHRLLQNKLTHDTLGSTLDPLLDQAQAELKAIEQYFDTRNHTNPAVQAPANRYIQNMLQIDQVIKQHGATLQTSNDQLANIVFLLQVLLLALLIRFVIFPNKRQLLQSQTLLKEKEELESAITHNSYIAAVTINTKGIIRSFNIAAEQYFAFGHTDIIGHSIDDILSAPEPDEMSYKYLLEQVDEERPSQLTGQKKFGGPFPLEVTVHPFSKMGKKHLLLLMRDVSDLHKAEQKSSQAQKMEAVGQLTGGIAHDFNNLLLIIQGNLRLLEEDLEEENDPDKLELLADALTAAEDGAELTDRLLSFSRKQALKPEVSDANELIDDFSRLIGRAIGSSVTFNIRTKPGLPLINIDRSQFQNALLNLSLNAKDAMLGGGELRISTNHTTIKEAHREYGFYLAPGEYVTVVIADTGTGMSDAVRKKVFDPFFTTKMAGHGTGMGLSMVYGFIKQSKGGITIRSTPGKGTVLTLLLPTYTPSQEPEVLPLQEQPQITRSNVNNMPPPRGTETVLVIEDEDRVRRFACNCLRELGYSVMETSNADEAHKLLSRKDHGFQAIFCDMIMPGQLSGLQLAHWTREMRPDTHILLTTGYSQGTHGEGTDKTFDVLYKPYTKKDLAKRLRMVLDKPEIKEA